MIEQSLLSKIFAGFKSRWIISAEFKYFKAAKILKVIVTICNKLKWIGLVIILCKSVGQISVTRYISVKLL